MLKYVDFFNNTRSENGTQGDPAMLVYDSFRDHLEESVKKKFWDSGFDLAVIPGDLTNVCQPLDISINKPFKDYLRKEWHIWMADGGVGETALENLRRARISDVRLWVKRSWEAISGEIIFESFKTCKISTDLNESDFDLEISDDDNSNSINDNNADDNADDIVDDGDDSIDDGDSNDDSD